MIATKIYWKRVGDHVHARFYTGKPRGDRAGNGTLIFKWDEWEVFRASLTVQPAPGYKVFTEEAPND